MKKLTLELDTWSHKELKEYLLSLNGVHKISIKDEKTLIIDIEYDEKKITSKILQMEINLFLDCQNEPTLLSFNKHTNNTEHTTIITDVCCEYCLKGFVEELFDEPGIISLNSNFDNSHFFDIKIELTYLKNVITLDHINDLVENFNK